MTSSSPPSSTAGEAVRTSGFDRAIATRFGGIARGYWRGATARSAWFWTGALAAFLLLKLVVDVAVNQWNRWFFDALERRDAGAIGWSIIVFLVIMLGLAAVGAGIVRSRETLQVQWRAWLAARLLDQWIAGQRFFRMTRAENGVVNPEYRISDDANLATSPIVDFAIGMFTALLSAATFVGILWSVGGALHVTLGGAAFEIPAFMVLGALAYGVTTSTLVPLIGRGLPQATEARNESEALFRAETIHLRENAETIALTRAEAFARKKLDATYAALVRNWMRMVRQHVNVTWIMNANTAMIPIVPLLMATPKYLTGELTLGQVIQLASAFTQVQYAIGWLADNYRNVAEWSASARRVVELVDALESLDEDGGGAQRFSTENSGDGCVELRGLTLANQTGRVLIESASARLAPGDHALIHGISGAGRGVLARALSGFWPWGRGALAMPGREPPAFLGAAPFLPTGRLRDAILCPGDGHEFANGDIAGALVAVGAAHLAQRLDENGRWMQALSPAERQRCAIARMILRRPTIILIEEALSACDAGAQADLTRTLFELCPQSVIIDFSNRPAPDALYNRRFTLAASAGGPSRLMEETGALVSSLQT